MRNRTTTVVLVLALAGLCGACDGETAGIDLPAIIITNTWSVEGDPDRSFSFTSDRDGHESGTFTGTESLPTEENPLTGSWGHGEITFTVQGSRNGAVYRGTFTDLTNRFTVQSSTETITLVRQT